MNDGLAVAMYICTFSLNSSPINRMFPNDLLRDIVSHSSKPTFFCFFSSSYQQKKQTNKQTDNQPETQIDRQINRQTETNSSYDMLTDIYYNE